MTGPSEIPEVALSVRQPWAWSFFIPPAGLPHGAAPKDVENRASRTTREVPFRMLIHASKEWVDDWPIAAGTIHTLTGLNIPLTLPMGAVVGAVTVADCHRTEPGCCASPWAMADARAHWRVTDPVKFPDPVPASGRLGLWPVTDLHVRTGVARQWAVAA